MKRWHLSIGRPAEHARDARAVIERVADILVASM
jgi:hypothetical protein